MSIFDNETAINELNVSIDVPAWIDQDISPHDVSSICQGGCASGAYMPAVTYHQALKTMSEHGDNVLQYIEDIFGELPQVPKGESWSGIACYYLSTAVEAWATGAYSMLEEHDDEVEAE